MRKSMKIAVISAMGLLILHSFYATALLSSSVRIQNSGILHTSKWTIRSVCMFPYDDYYSQSSTNDKLNEIKQRLPEVNYIEIRTYWKPDPLDSNNMVYSAGQIGYLDTPLNSWSELEAAVSKIRSKNLRVILWAAKDWDADFPNPSNWTLWLQNYAQYVKTVAVWAQEQQIPIFVFGVEYDALIDDYSILGSKYVTQWNQIISEVRSVYFGQISYGFNWWYDPLHWETIYNQSSWVSNLDFIQVDTFVSLGINVYDGYNATELAKWWNPTIQDLMGNWTKSHWGPNWNYVQMYEQLSSKYGKKILINLGYRNNNGTNTMPWINVYMRDNYGNSIPGWGPDVREMNDCWEAFFLTWSSSSAILGVDMEHYTQVNTNDLDGSFRNKYDATSGNYTWQIIHYYLSQI
jgi:hypothetical protein